jgi:putative ABC transport system permease protein
VFGRKAPKQASDWITIVGVVADTKLYGLDNPSRLEVYLSYRQHPRNNATVLVKSSLDPAAVTKAMRGVVQTLDPDQPVPDVKSMSDLRAQSMSTRRSTLALLGVFSALAIVLAAIGIYGVMSYTVTLRTHELGVRLALGALPAHVLGTILGQGMALAGGGIVLGLAAAFGVTRLMATLLFDVSALDPAIFAGVTAGLVLVAVVACYIPARRTLGVDPLIALRHE